MNEGFIAAYSGSLDDFFNKGVGVIAWTAVSYENKII